MLDNEIGNISLSFVLFYYNYKFYNFVILCGLLLFVFGMDTEVAFCRLWHISLFIFVKEMW